MMRAKPVTLLPKGRKAIARLYDDSLVILWDGGMATKKPSTQADFDALPAELEPGALVGFDVVVDRNGAP